MLALHDAQIVDRDPDIRGLRILLDDESLAMFAAKFLSTAKVERAECDYLRYKPGQNCLARFRVLGSGQPQHFYAVAYRPSDLVKVQKVRGAFTSTELCLVVCPFPMDLELKSLTRISSDEGLRHLLAKMGCHQMLGGPLSLTTLRYKPERRYVARIESDAHPAILKMYSAATFPAAYAAARSFATAQNLPIAHRLARSRRHGVILFDWQAGTPLSAMMETGLATPEIIAKAGAALAQLHSCSVSNLPTVTATDDAASLRDTANDLTAIAPNLAKQITQLAMRICDKLAVANVSTFVPTHGDFSAAQIIVEGGNVSLIDLDRAVFSAAEKDVGNFIAHLTLTQLQGRSLADDFTTIVDALATGYRATGRNLMQSEVDLHTAASLLRLANRPFRDRLPDWHDLTLRIVHRGGEILLPAISRSAAAVGVAEPTGSSVPTSRGLHPDNEMPFLQDALSLKRAEDRLQDVLSADPELQGFHVQSVRVLRSKPGRRCLVEYRGTLANTSRSAAILGKIHAKHRHEASYRQQTLLWNAGFDNNSPDRISVARPLGIISEWNMWLQRAVPGQTSWHALEGANACMIASRIADAAHKLHRAAVPTDRIHTLENELSILDEHLLCVCRELPALGRRIDDIRFRCRELAESINPVRPVGIHRDFYPDQVLVDDDRLYVVDHDLYCLGDPRLDVGNFCGHLIEQSLRKCGHPYVYDQAAQAMIDRFAELNGDEGYRDAIDIYVVLTLARHIALSRRFPERIGTTFPLVELIESRLASRCVGSVFARGSF
jgi:aminoglycoside phosphotransferase (APT) family kinase protein